MVGVVFIGVKGDDRCRSFRGFPLGETKSGNVQGGGFIAKPRATGSIPAMSELRSTLEAFSTPTSTFMTKRKRRGGREKDERIEK